MEFKRLESWEMSYLTGFGYEVKDAFSVTPSHEEGLIVISHDSDVESLPPNVRAVRQVYIHSKETIDTELLENEIILGPSTPQNIRAKAITMSYCAAGSIVEYVPVTSPVEAQ